MSENGGSEARDHIDCLGEVLRRIDVLRDGERDAATAQRLLDALRAPDSPFDVLGELFPPTFADGAPFFDVLAELRTFIGFGRSGNEAIEELWLKVLQGKTSEQQQQHLMCFAANSGHDIFPLLNCIARLLKEIPLPTAFLAGWLLAIHAMIERDMMQGPFWAALRGFALSCTASAAELLRELVDTASAPALQIGSQLLGILRRSEAEPSTQASVTETQSRLATETANAAFQRSYFRSWTTTAFEYGLTEDELVSLLAEAETRRPNAAEQLLAALCAILPSEKTSLTVRSRIVDWSAQRVTSALADDTKHELINSVLQLQSRKNAETDLLGRVLPWVVAVQPVNVANKGTWRLIELVLLELSKADPEQFRRLFLGLADANAANMVVLMEDNDGLAHLLGQVPGDTWGVLTGTLLSSPTTSNRRLGLHLFESLPLSVSKNVSLPTDGLRVQLLFYELQCAAVQPRALAHLMIKLISVSDNLDEAFQNDLDAELDLQCRNFRGQFRIELQQAANDFPRIAAALQRAEEYFEQLKRSNSSEVGQMDVPGAERGHILYRRRMSRTVSEATEKHSVLLKLFKTTQLLYGRASSSYFDGTLQNAHPLMPFSTSIEVPYLELADPEMMLMRRRNALREIHRLTGSVHDSGEDADAE